MKHIFSFLVLFACSLYGEEQCNENACQLPQQEEICEAPCYEYCDYTYQFGRQFGNYVEDPDEELELDASWPAKREEFSDQLFR